DIYAVHPLGKHVPSDMVPLINHQALLSGVRQLPCQRCTGQACANKEVIKRHMLSFVCNLCADTFRKALRHVIQHSITHAGIYTNPESIFRNEIADGEISHHTVSVASTECVKARMAN